jgi:DNA segregation ATPase FtsK/SpoIIIE, S-DNA-T family
VAGTTGAGKSEFLQTLVVSLALANRPTAINFVFIDYKGGSAFADCEYLPHTVGMVTNLDGHLTERALVSLDAELKRREQVLRGGLTSTPRGSATPTEPPPMDWLGWSSSLTSSLSWSMSCPSSLPGLSASPGSAVLLESI